MNKTAQILVGIVHAFIAGASFLFLFGLMFTLARIEKQAINTGIILSAVGFTLALIPGSRLATNAVAAITGSLIAHALFLSAVFANASGPGSEYPMTLTLFAILHLAFLIGGGALGYAAILLKQKRNEK